MNKVQAASDKWIGFARTVAPLLWSWILLQITPILTWLEAFVTSVGIEFSEAQLASFEQGVIAILAAAIYAAVTKLSEWFPLIQFLLIIPIKPTYRLRDE